MTARIPGVILAGGASRRMGRDKALVLLGGRTLLALTAQRLAPQCGPLAISRHDGHLDGADDLGLPVLRDGPANRAGPLAGVLAGLDWAAGASPGATHLLTAPVDAPFLPADLAVRLAAAAGAGMAAGSGAAVAASGGRRHPVAALWPVAARGALRAALDAGLTRAGAFLDVVKAAEVDWPTVPDDPFRNINAPEDLAAAENYMERPRRP